MSMKFAVGLVGATALAASSMSVAHAAPFGPATAAVQPAGNAPVVGASTILLGGTAGLNGGTGTLVAANLAGGNGSGPVSGTFGYSTTIGSTVNTSITKLFSFPAGGSFSGSFDFDLTSVTTTSFVNTGPSGQTTIGLYLLGTMYDTAQGLSPTATSFSLTFNSTSGSAFSYSGSLANPPAPLPPPPSVPEPASLALLGVALAGLGAARRRKR